MPEKSRPTVQNILHTACRWIVRALPYIFLTVGGIVMLYPVLFSLLGSVSTQAEYEETLFLPIPHTSFSEIDNFLLIFQGTVFLKPLLLTLARVAVNIAIPTTVALFGGYVFAKVDFKFKRAAFMVLLSSMMIPGVALMVPNYIWMSRFPFVGGNMVFSGGMGFINNPAILFVTGWVNVYAIFLFRQSFVSIGNELAESGEMDGANFVLIIVKLYLPLVMPIVAVLSLNCFLGTWNDYMTSTIYLRNHPDVSLVATAANGLIEVFRSQQRIGGPDYPKAFAVSTVMMVPPIIVFLFVQKQFVEGLTMGAVKG